MQIAFLAILITSASGCIAGRTTCPGRGTVKYAGVELSTCKNTSIRGETISQYPGAKGIKDCAKMCAVTAGCERAVYDKRLQWCYIKGPGATESNPDKNYDTATVTKQIADGENIGTCYTPKGSTDDFTKSDEGYSYANCLNGDYQADSTNIVTLGSLQECNDFAAKSDSGNAVWVSAFNACHIKPTEPGFLTFRRGMVRILVEQESQ